MNLPNPLYSAAQSRELDRLAMTEHGLAGSELMERAGAAAFALLQQRWPDARKITVLCGTGNNGGDGYIIARLARESGLAVKVLALGDAAQVKGDARVARDACRAGDGEILEYSEALLPESEIIVDAVFGTGLERDVAGIWAQAIDAVNRLSLPVLAVDLPSGLHADSGRVLGSSIRAEATISFIGLKAGMFTADGPEHCGHIVFDDLGVPAAVYAAMTPMAHRFTGDQLTSCLPRRRRNTHKGESGRVLLIGGGPGMPGAVRLAGEAALYTGAGLVTVATHPEHAAAISASRPELITRGIEYGKQIAPLIKNARVIAIGPGLGQTAWAKDIMASVMESDSPIVMDADALNLLAEEPAQSRHWILTPHPGEAARLLKSSTRTIQKDRMDAARALVQAYGGICVLKGAGTIVANGETLTICTAGNPALATAGTGDLLTGAIASFWAQGLNAFDAARVGVWVHARSADVLASPGERGWLASDFLPVMRAQVQLLEEGSR